MAITRLRMSFLLTVVLFVLAGALSGDVYWQQEVNYEMEVTLADDLRTVSGFIGIEYINNSPDTLNRLYLKAFPNAIQKGSYADRKLRSQNDYSYAALSPERAGRLELRDHSSIHPAYESFEADNTIITVRLSRPLSPGDTTRLEFDFTTVLPAPPSMRMGYTRGTTKAVYWYPQVCVYDGKLGWVNSQYLGWGECYGDYGRYDVTVTAPEDQIVAATGVLVNTHEVLPDSLRALLDISNFQRPRSEWPKLAFDRTKRKTWHYVADNVNDFVWVSSNEFCIDSDTINGVEVVAYPLRYKADGWANAVELAKQSIETYSELYYPYQWPVLRICDAYSGMEYPMLALCTGQRPSPWYSLLFYHEIGHEWFMGMVGSNQVDRPFLDEGTTTHMEHNAMEKYLGREGNYDYFTNWYQKKFAPPTEDRNARGFRPLLLLMKEGLDRPIIYTSYDQGKEYWPYRVSAYYKCAAMHYSLRSVLGDSLYYAAMHHYCDKWLFRHPYEDDFTQAMEEATGIEMDNYLDQWYYSRHRLDYAFGGMKVRRSGRQHEHTVKLEREGDFVAPVDVAVIWEQGDTTFYTVAPEGMAYAKPGYILLPTWHQFRRLERNYEFGVSAMRRIKKVVVDPHNLLMDIDRRNNQSGFFWPTELRLDNMIYDRTPVNRYALRLRPDLWYDEPNGTQVGLHAHGSYLETEARFSLDARVGTESARPTLDLVWSNPFAPFITLSTVSQRILRADRRIYTSTTYEKEFRTWYSRPDNVFVRLELDYLNVSGQQEHRRQPFPEYVRKYLPDVTWDASETYYARLTTGWLRTFRYGSYHLTNREALASYEEEGRHRAFLETQLLGGVDLTNRRRTYLSLGLEYLSTRGEPPSQYLRHLSRVRSVDRFTRSPVFRSPGTFPVEWEDDFYLANGRVRGYQDRIYYLTDFIGGSLELTPPDLLPYRWLRIIPLAGGWLGRMDQAVFVDGGWVSFGDKEWCYPEPVASNETVSADDEWTFVVSSGVSAVLPSFWRQNRVRVDFPLYLNRPAAGDDEFDFRVSVAWLLPPEW